MKTFIYLSVFILFSNICHAEKVVAEGMADNDSASSKEQALTDALREAVRIGAGVNLLNQSKTTNFSLEYDRVFSAAFGYVKAYQVIECGLKNDGFYHVKISADVSKGDPDINEKLALRQLIALKNAPRIAFDIRENITFVPKNSGYANSWFQEHAKELQLHVVSSEKYRESLVAQGDSKVRANHKEQSPATVDFIIRGVVEGKYQVIDSGDDNPYAITASFEALNPETNEVIASVNLKPTGQIKSKIESPQLAAKNIIEKCLNGNEKNGDSGASVLFRRIFTRWASDLDLGRKVRIEIERIDDSALRRFIEKMRGSEKISAVKKREFNSNGVTIVDLETRLNSDELTKCILTAMNNEYQVNYSTENIIFLVKDKTPYWKKSLDLMLSKLGF